MYSQRLLWARFCNAKTVGRSCWPRTIDTVLTGKYLNCLLGLSALFLLVSPVRSFASDSERPLIDGPAYTHPQRLVEIEPGRRLNLYCIGSGSPAVIFDAGLTDPINVWGYVQPVVARYTRACSYDRAGVGFSDAGRRPATSANIVDDLHRLLVAAAVEPPYVLVGASYGGMNARLYAYTYPSEVAGMVLIDPIDENQTEGYRNLDPEQRTPEQWNAYAIEPSLEMRRDCIAEANKGFVKGTEPFRKCSFSQYPQLSEAVQAATIEFQMLPAFQKAQLSEEESVFRASAEELRAARRPYGDLPLIVLTKSAAPPPKNSLTPEQLALREARYRLWVNLHANVAALSTRGVHEIVQDSGHGIQLEQPDAVNTAISKVLKLARNTK